jgi:WD40 repeat protein
LHPIKALPSKLTKITISLFFFFFFFFFFQIMNKLFSLAFSLFYDRLLVLTASGEVIEVVRDSRAATQLFCGHTQVYQGVEISGGEVKIQDKSRTTGGGVSSRSSSDLNSNSAQKPLKQIEGCSSYARHPTETDLFVTGGGDGTLRLWSKSGKCVLSILEVASAVNALAWFIPKAVDGTASKTDATASVDENGEAIHSLAVVLAPAGKVLHVSLNLTTMELTNTKVLIPTISPVPDSIVGCLSGPRIFKTSARVKAGRYGEVEDIVKHFAMASGSVIDDAAANKASFPSKDKDPSADIDAAGACIFLY